MTDQAAYRLVYKKTRASAPAIQYPLSAISCNHTWSSGAKSDQSNKTQRDFNLLLSSDTCIHGQ